MAPTPKLVVLLSGGMDSATLLGLFKDTYEIHPISFFYGQKHSRELTSAMALCEHYKLSPKMIDISFFKDLAPSALTQEGQDVPDGRYDEEVMKQTVKPNRNMILLSIAAAYAIGLKSYRVAYAAHSGDHTIYPDCRPEFIGAMTNAFRKCDFEHIALITPFNGMSKADVLRTGLELRVPYSLTWSCYKGGERACGRCGTCFERLEAFHENGIEDPLLYEDREWWLHYKVGQEELKEEKMK